LGASGPSGSLGAVSSPERWAAILTLEREQDEAVISVQDNGIGIPPEALESVFEMFSQVHAPRTEGGLGIGLSLVRSLVQMHGGSVTAFSEGLGSGSTFTVRLPLAGGSAEQPDITAQPGLRSRSQRVLVVDDNTDPADSMALLLEMEGHTVRTAADGEEAIEQARTFQPDIIFMDLGMPRVDGAEAARRIRQLPQGARVRIVALTGWGARCGPRADARGRNGSSSGQAHQAGRPPELLGRLGL
jgi:hypothetical protein